MKKKTILKIAAWTASVFVILLAVLVIHIYMVTSKPKDNLPLSQLSRIDFKQPLSQAQSDEIKGYVASLEGVESTYFNQQNGILVYTYQVGKQTSANVFEQLMKHGSYKAERYIVTEAMLQNGCPMGAGKNTFTGHLTRYISNMFN